MGEYDSGPRPLPWPLLHPLVDTQTVEDDEDFPPSSFVWPADPDERTVIPFWLSLNEYNVLGSTIDVGSDVAFGEDALRVMWLWMRNFRIEVPMATTQQCCGPSITDRLNAQTYNTGVLSEYETTQTQYETDGETLTTVAPNMDPFNTSQDGIDQILCLGYEMMLRSIVNQARGVHALNQEAAQDLIEQLGIAMAGLSAAGGIALGLGGAVAGLVALIGGPWALLGLALGGIGVGIASEFLTLDSSVIDDTGAFDDVLCTMRQNGMGQPPSFEMFAGLLAPNTFEPDSNAEKLAAIVQPFLNDVPFFLQFMISMSDLYAVDIWDYLPLCEVCPPDLACDGGEGVNFLASDGMFTPNLDRAEYHSGGINRGWGIAPLVNNQNVQIVRAMAPTPIRIKVNTFETGDQLSVYNWDAGSVTLLGSSSGETEEPDGTFTYVIESVTPATDDVMIAFSTSGAYSEDFRIRSVCWNYDV